MEISRHAFVTGLTWIISLPFIAFFGWVTYMGVFAPIVESQKTIAAAEAEKLRVAQETQDLENAPTSDFFIYYALSTTKTEYKLGEVIETYSDREIKQIYPIGGVDDLICDNYDDTGFGIKTTKERSNPNPIVVDRERRKRAYQGELPTNPPGVYYPATCYIKAKICMLVRSDINPKCQTIESNQFIIK